jgi:hypothetical protein
MIAVMQMALDTDYRQVARILGASLCFCFLPLIIIAILFLTFLAHDLDGKHDYSNSLIFGLLIAYEVLVSFGMVVLMLSLNTYLQHEEERQRIVLGMQRHGQDTTSTASESSEARTKLEEEANGGLIETTKKVRLVRETSTLFRRMASSYHGIDIDGLDGTSPAGSPSASTPSAGSGSGEFGGDEEEEVCSICMASPRSAVLQPCGHGGFCYDCGKIMASRRTKCPLCRATISEVLHYDASTSSGREVVADTSASRLSTL